MFLAQPLSGGGVTNFNFTRKIFNTGGHYDHFGRDFRVNDIGFLRVRANRNQANVVLRWEYVRGSTIFVV